jgi:hypothetical protein
VTRGLNYLVEVAPDAIAKNYEYGGVADLRVKMAAGQGLGAYNLEQQGKIVEDYFVLRQTARQEEVANGGYASFATRADLDVYIHFVQEVSTLTPVQLDTPDPPITVPHTVLETTTVTTGTASPGSPVSPVVSVDPNTNVLLDVAFDQFSSLPSRKTPALSEPVEETTSGSESFSPVSIRALDLALESLS